MIAPFYAFLKGENNNISPLIQPSDQPSMLDSCNNTYKIGAILKDTGYAIQGAQIEDNKSILGLYNFIQAPGTEKMLATVDDATSDDTQLFYKIGSGDWTEIAGAETAWANHAGIDVNMESFIGYCFFVGYGATDGFIPSCSLTGTTFSTSACVTSMPEAKYITRYRDRLYVANCNIGSTTYPYRVYFSSVPSVGAITWTVATDYFDVDYSDEITGIVENWDRLMIFTDYKAYFYDQSQKKKLWQCGCSAHRTIKNSGAYTIWANGDGVWISTGGQPQNIAGEIMSFIRAGNPKAWFGEMVDEEYWLHLGNVTVDGVSYANCVKIYNIPLNAWRTRELGDVAKTFAKCNVSGKQYLWIGDNDGNVFQKGKYTDASLVSSDNTKAIASNFELAPIHLQSIDKLKAVKAIIAYSERAQGLNLQARVLDKNARVLMPYKPLGQLTKFINSFDVNMEGGVFIQIAGSESSTLPYWSFYGFALDVELESRILKQKR
jgi:hypothetical protein